MSQALFELASIMNVSAETPNRVSIAG